MKTTLTILKWIFVLTLSACLFSCEQEDDENETDGVYATGVFILNEGAFGNGNASVSYIENNGKVTAGIFSGANKRPLGDVLQSASKGNDQIFLVVNNSNKIEVVEASSFESEGVIDFIRSPRYALWNGSNGYVTSWASASVVVFNTALDSVTSISVGSGPEQLLLNNNDLWVANSGGLGLDSTVSIIDITNNSVSRTIDVRGANPKDFVQDKNGHIWVLCAGHTEYDDSWNVIGETPAQLVQISSTTYEILKTIMIDNGKPGHLEIDQAGETLYYGGGFGFAGIYQLSIDATSSASTALINGNFYGFSVHPNNGTIYGCIAPSFTSNGSVQTYDVDGTLRNIYEAGVGPNSILF